jgi:hypothetical protein
MLKRGEHAPRAPNSSYDRNFELTRFNHQEDHQMTTQTTGAQSSISRHWLDVLEANNVNFMVLDPVHDIYLIEQLQSHPGWMVEFASEEAVFFVRDEFAFIK